MEFGGKIVVGLLLFGGLFGFLWLMWWGYVVEPESRQKECPYCKLVIPISATKCPNCTADIGHRPSTASQQKTTKKKSAKIEASTQMDDKPASNPRVVVSDSAKGIDSQSNLKCKNIRNEEGRSYMTVLTAVLIHK